MTTQKFRVGGGYTTFSFNGTPLLYLETLADRAPQPVGSGPEPIHPLGEPHPIEIAFPKAHGTGTLTLTIKEQWGSDIWQSLPGYENDTDILSVFASNVSAGNVVCSKVITAPDGSKRTTYYHGCVITNIDEGETVSVGTMTFPKTITVMYTHRTRG